jgi:hypothetical protein
VKKTTPKSKGTLPRDQFPHQSDESSRESEPTQSAPADNLEKITDFIRQRKAPRTARSLRATTPAAPVFSSEPLIAYRFDPDLARREQVMLTVKTTLQLEKNDFQAEHLKRQSPTVFGRETARPYVMGIVAAFSLAHDRFDWSLVESKWVFSVVEPYGVDARGNKMALATADSVRLMDIETGEARSCQNPWLNQAHTVEFSANGKKLLVGSSGFDAIFEFDTASKSFGNGSLGIMASTDQSWVTSSFVRRQDAERSQPWVTKCFWWMIRQNTNLVFLPVKNRHISTAPATTRMERFLLLCSIKERAM